MLKQVQERKKKKKIQFFFFDWTLAAIDSVDILYDNSVCFLCDITVKRFASTDIFFLYSFLPSNLSLCQRARKHQLFSLKEPFQLYSKLADVEHTEKRFFSILIRDHFKYKFFFSFGKKIHEISLHSSLSY